MFEFNSGSKYFDRISFQNLTESVRVIVTFPSAHNPPAMCCMRESSFNWHLTLKVSTSPITLDDSSFKSAVNGAMKHTTLG